MLPVIILLASAAMTAPVALTSTSEFELSRNPETMGAYVREYFADQPIMAEIAKCESRFRHLAPNGDIIRGKVNKSDIGVMQINTYYHEEAADELGIDLYSLDGNLEYARYLHEREGTKPWNSSRPCWGKYATAK
ncbi:hypothetical protein KGO06_00560 [Patescibacteria group bacterium]|nr:hypothetical protein [Patescibacteria group bacterium]